MHEELLKRRDLMRVYNVSLPTIDRWRHNGTLPAPIVICGTVRWRRSDIEAHLAESVEKRSAA